MVHLGPWNNTGAPHYRRREFSSQIVSIKLNLRCDIFDHEASFYRVVDVASPTMHVANYGAPPTSSVQLPAGITAAPSIPFGYHAPILLPNQFLPSVSPGGPFSCTFEFIFVTSLCAFFFGICALVVFFSPARQPRWRLVEVCPTRGIRQRGQSHPMT